MSHREELQEGFVTIVATLFTEEEQRLLHRLGAERYSRPTLGNGYAFADWALTTRTADVPALLAFLRLTPGGAAGAAGLLELLNLPPIELVGFGAGRMPMFPPGAP